MRIFVSGTGTGVGKTYFSCALARAARARGESVVALKPIETGCAPDPADAHALAEASGHDVDALPGFYRARPPLAPAAIDPPPDFDAVVAATRDAMGRAPHAIVEGAGGVLVPLDATRSMLDLAAALELPVVLVARDGLGVLSHTLTAAESVLSRGLRLHHVVLAQHGDTDPSRERNRALLAERLACPVSPFKDDAGPIWDALTAP